MKRFLITETLRQRVVRSIGLVLLPTGLAGVPAFGQTSMPAMPGMDHSSMPGMGQGAMQGMDHGSMPDMGRGTPKKAPPAKQPTTPDSTVGRNPAAPAKPEGAEARQPSLSEQPATRSSIYRRNPDGSYVIPGTGMAMADDDIFYLVLFDKLEYARARDGRGMSWDVQAWVGRDYNRFWFKTEGDRVGGRTEARMEALWSRAVAAFWDAQLGVRQDFGQAPSRQWLAFGVQGIAPYWFNIEAAGYVGPSGRTAARLKAEYSVRLSQVMFLTPEFEADAYGKSDPARGIGSGLSDAQLGLRLRYEIRREIAPYLGVVWTRKFGSTADMARLAGARASDRQIVAGVRIWF